MAIASSTTHLFPFLLSQGFMFRLVPAQILFNQKFEYMTTRARTTKKRSRSKVAAKTEGNGKKALTLLIENLPISRVIPDTIKPRKTFNEADLQLLSKSIKEHGVLKPITVREFGKDSIIVMGERLYRASKFANKKTM